MKTTDRLPPSGARSRRYASHRLHPHGPPTRCPNRILPFRARSIQTGTNPSRTGRNVAALKGAPNVILILLDDVGFGATATFGGPVATPFLSRLAASGLRYNRFHINAMCPPTRGALLCGRNNHVVGFGVITESAAGYPGYNSVWPTSAASVAEVLRLASSEKSVGHRYAPMGTGSSARAAREPDVG